MIEKLARSQAPLYITGESGSGKELAARLIHEGGARRDKPFVPVNCGAIPENLVESEFFGYRKGAFTGADADREGFFHAANGGTLFLDEVADLPLAMQVKLLRAIQEKRVRKSRARPPRTRSTCGSSARRTRLLPALVEAGKFRQDLYYRLAVIELRMPSLRECREDIPLLADAVLARLGEESGARRPRLSAMRRCAALADYDFPGNVRELENVLERAIALSGSEEIQPDDLQLAPPKLAEERAGARTRSGRCRSISTASSAMRSWRRSTGRASTGPRRRSSSASPSAPSATGWSGSGSTSAAWRSGSSAQAAHRGRRPRLSGRVRRFASMRPARSGRPRRLPRRTPTTAPPAPRSPCSSFTTSACRRGSSAVTTSSDSLRTLSTARRIRRTERCAGCVSRRIFSCGATAGARPIRSRAGSGPGTPASFDVART